MLTLLLFCGRVEAQVYRYFTGAVDQKWETGGNWNAPGEPAITNDVHIGELGQGSPRTCIISLPGEAAKSVAIGEGGGIGTLVVTNGGDLTVSNTLAVGWTGVGYVYQYPGTLVQAATVQFGSPWNATGYYYQVGGTVSCTTFHMPYIYGQPSTGYYELAEGLLTNALQSYIGHAGVATFRQTGGTHLNVGAGMYIGGTQYGVAGTGIYELVAGQLKAYSLTLGHTNKVGIVRQSGGTNDLTENISITRGSYELTGGLLDTRASQVGYGGPGTFTQTGGKWHLDSVGFGLVLGNDTNSWGTYNLWGGELEHVGGPLALNFRSTFNIGTNSGTGTAYFSGGVWIRAGEAVPHDQATLRGWGTIGGSPLKNSGRVIADGYGTDRTLDLSDAVVQDGYATTHTSTNGWFAQNHGRLLLKGITFSGSSNCWGDVVGNPKLVNSVVFQYTGGSGTLTGALLASDHGSVNNLLVRPIGVWDFSGPAFTTCTLTIRYDDLRAAALGVPESDLKVFQFAAGKWKEITGAVDTNANRITATALAPLSVIAVAPSVRAVGTVVLIQ